MILFLFRLVKNKWLFFVLQWLCAWQRSTECDWSKLWKTNSKEEKPSWRESWAKTKYTLGVLVHEWVHSTRSNLNLMNPLGIVSWHAYSMAVYHCHSLSPSRLVLSLSLSLECHETKKDELIEKINHTINWIFQLSFCQKRVPCLWCCELVESMSKFLYQNIWFYIDRFRGSFHGRVSA